MAAPAISSAIDAVIAKVEAITPTVDAGLKFRRSDEKSLPSTRGGKRLFDFDFGGHRADLSNDGRGGTQTVGLADRVASVVLDIVYPVGNGEKALESTLAIDSELVLRALHRAASWTGTVVRRCSARSTVDRSAAEAFDAVPGVIHLRVAVDIQYRDDERSA